MKLTSKIKDFLTGSKRQKLIDNLHRLIEVEQRYLLEGFGLEYLENELGVDQECLVELLRTEYKVPFFQLLIQLRIAHLKTLVSRYGDKLSLADYARFTGFKEVNTMLHVLNQETGLDFDDFCKYSQELAIRQDRDFESGENKLKSQYK